MEKWSVEKAAEWSAANGWLRGFNYRPADCRNSVEIFQEYGFEQHLPIMEAKCGWRKTPDSILCV